jgi:hypothetical protein
MTETLFALVPGAVAAVFIWLWRRDKRVVKAAEERATAAFRELATSQKLVLDLRVLLARYNNELKECREKLPAAAGLDDFFNGMPKRNPSRDNS